MIDNKEDNLIKIKEDNFNSKEEIKIWFKIIIEIQNLIMNLIIIINKHLRIFKILENLIHKIMNKIIIILFNNKKDLIKDQKMKIHKIIDFNKNNNNNNKEMIIDIKIEDKIRMNFKIIIIIKDNLNVKIKYYHKFKLLKLVNLFNLYILKNLKF